MNFKDLEFQSFSIKRNLSDHAVHWVPFWSSSYPRKLRQITDFPAFIFYKGDLSKDILNKGGGTVAIVGTRSMSEYGARMTREIVRPLVRSGVTIVSGLASGVDSLAHELALDVSNDCYPVAVLPGGPEDGFPEMSRGLYNNIVKSGLVISEFLPGTKITPNMFASRNRLIAGLSDCVVVVEAPLKSGALITADLALQYGRDVCAVPGRAVDSGSLGVNKLIQEGAALVNNGYEVIEIMGGGRGSDRDDSQNDLSQENIQLRNINKVRHLLDGLEVLSSIEEEIISRINENTLDVDFIVNKAGKSPSEVRSILTKLEIEGILRLDYRGKIKFE
ncbi:DNA-processing protein DprA [Candidatus Dojkabacteria bacterium]|nr:DNA-processing protein DprA [Candidatus Dojkabacteria bacterium]